MVIIEVKEMKRLNSKDFLQVCEALLESDNAPKVEYRYINA